ncbi:MAG TPA: hypothetical protein VGP41_08540 [Candidatus Lustribacter sp.]|nr:hypothetical protein [Candidatus Lustribacter sp.]
MNCGACGREAEFDSTESYSELRGIAFVTVIGNGRRCMDCETFTCSQCFAAFELLGTEFADPDLCIPCNTAPTVAPETAPASQLIGIARTSRAQAQRPEAVNRESRSETVLLPQNAASVASQKRNARHLEDNAMSSPFNNSTPAQEAIVLDRSVHPGYLDLPYVFEEILIDGRRDFGNTLEVDQLAVDDLVALEATLDDYARDVAAQIAALRRKIAERAYVLDVTGRLPLGIAA